MQNLSLPVTQTSSLKKSADSVQKNNQSTENLATTKPNSSFQAMLSKHVQVKQTLAQQAPDKPSGSKHAAVDHKSKTKADKNNQDTLADNLDSMSQAQVEVGSKTLVVKLEPEDLQLEDSAANTPNASVIALFPGLSTPITKIQKNLPDLSVSNGPNLVSAPETTAQQQDMDMVLADTSLQNKNSKVLETGIQTTQYLPDNKSLSDNISKQDLASAGLAPMATAKQAAGDEPITAVSMLNIIKAGLGREDVAKEITAPIVYQPLTKINTDLSMQQVASTSQINIYPGKPGWDQAISQRVVWMVGAGEQSATLTLNPPDLGPLQVVIHVHNNLADTTFISDNAEVRQALQDGMSNLREKMGESGVQLGQANVNSGEQSQRNFQSGMQNRAASQASNADSVLPEENLTSVNTLVRAANGLVDTFV